MAQHVERRFEGSLPVVGDGGRKLSVSLYINYTIFEPLSGPAVRLPGAYSIELDDGSTAQLLEDETFRVDGSGEILRLDN
jgi:hypothetical protein